MSLGALIAHRFIIEQVAASGGMGIVYRARDLQTGEPVAIKILNRAKSNTEAIRLLREAKLLGDVRHPGIVSYLEHGTTLEGKSFLVMEWLAGEDLAQRLSRQGLSLRESLCLLHRLAQALNVAHERGIIHRDLKPSNVFLRNKEINGATLLDFGIARQISDGEAITRTGEIIGTPQYMAPEQANGQASIGPACDIYALGCILFNCLTGRTPFEGEHLAALLAKTLFQNPPLLREVRPSMPEPLEQLLTHMLAKHPLERPADAAALLEVLNRLPEFEEQAPPITSREAVSSLAGLGEQQLISVIIALNQATTSEEISTLALELNSTSRSEATLLRSALSVYGARVEILVDGSIVATLDHLLSGSATDQAMQAARCAIVIREHLPKAIIILATGKGILNSRVPMGDVIDRAWELSKRIQTMTPRSIDSAGGIILDETSAALLDGRFQITRLGSAIYELHNERTSFDPSRPLLGKPTPCLGREREMVILDGLFEECRTESLARGILITASPGVGKSRLRHEFVRRLESRQEDVEILMARGDPHFMGTPYGLFGQALRRLCELSDSGTTEERRAKLMSRVSLNLPSETARRITPFLCKLCSIPFLDDDSPLLRQARQDPRLLAEKIQQALADFFRAECAKRPVLFILEDLHWGDTVSVSLLNWLLRELSECPILLLAVARLDIYEQFPALWSERKFQELRLEPLSKRTSERLLRQVMGAEIRTETLNRIVEQAAGNPLFLEELARATVEGNIDALPESVLAMLQSRLMRLQPDVRRILRIASVYGQTFWKGVLPAEALDSSLGMLIESEIIEQHRESRFANEIEYGFRHMLMREAAYGMLTDSEAKTWHRQASQTLEQLGESDPIVLAEHADRGGDAVRAIPLLLAAARQAFERNDLQGATNCAKRGIACGAKGEQLGSLTTMLALALYWQGEFAAAYEFGMRGFSLSPQGSFWWCQFVGCMFSVASLMGKQDIMLELIESLANADPEPAARVSYLEGAAMMSNMSCLYGMVAQAKNIYDCLVRVEKDVAPNDYVARAWSCFGKTWYFRAIAGDPWQTRITATQCLSYSMTAGSQRLIMVGQLCMGIACADLGDIPRSLEHFRALIDFANRMKENTAILTGQWYMAGVLAHFGHSTHHPDYLEEASSLMQALSANAPPPYSVIAHAVYAEALLLGGDSQQAEAQIRIAVSDSPFYQAGILAIFLKILLVQGKLDEARQRSVQAKKLLMKEHAAAYCEVALRLTCAEILQAAGELESAKAELQEASRQIQRRAKGIDDADAQMRFLSEVPENARTLELCRSLLESTMA